MRGWKPTKAFWKGYSELYGEQIELEEGDSLGSPKKTAPRALNCPTEQQEQFTAVAWLRKKGVPFYHVPNGGRRDYIEAAKFKRLGVSAGVPDLCLPIARKGYHGLYIELKRVSGGKLSETQMTWRDILLREGYAWYEAKGAADLIQFVENYLQ